MLKEIQLKLNDILSIKILLKIIIIFSVFSLLYFVLNLYYYKNYRNLNERNKEILEIKIIEYINSKYQKLKSNQKEEILDNLILNVPRYAKLNNKNFDNSINEINTLCDQINNEGKK